MFPRDTIIATLTRLRAEAGLQEAMILSTCNRVEVYARADDDKAPDAVAAFLSTFHGRPTGEIAKLGYCLQESAAVQHAFRVAASLDSMVVGEPQILGQVKEAYRAAEEAGTLGSLLNALRNRTLAAAKRARTRDGHRRERGLRLARRRGAGAQDLRRPAGQERAAGGRRQDERAGRAAAGAGRGAGHGGGRPHARAGGRAGGGARRTRGASRDAADGAGARGHRDQRHRRARHRHPAGATSRPRGARAAGGRCS